MVYGHGKACGVQRWTLAGDITGVGRSRGQSVVVDSITGSRDMVPVIWAGKIPVAWSKGLRGMRGGCMC